jgi:3-mercaptopyruvate sulfurtransferase SseA
MRIRFGALVFTVVALIVITPPGAGARDQQPDREEDTSAPSLRIDWKEFKKLYDSNTLDLVDVRGGVFFESGHIPGARSIPLDQIETHIAELRRSKRPIVLYCA